MPEPDFTRESELFDAFVREAERRKTDLRPVTTLRFTWSEAWLLMAQLQIALRHPENDSAGAEYARHLVEHLAKHCATTPELRQIVELGQAAPPADEHEWLEATLP